MTTIYVAKDTFGFDKQKVQIYGEALEQVRIESGKLTPKSIVEAARNPINPLHECFVWDDSIAAEKYRRAQARELVSGIEVRVVHQDAAPAKNTTFKAEAFASPPPTKKRRVKVVAQPTDSEVEFIDRVIRQLDFWIQEAGDNVVILRVLQKAKYELKRIRATQKKRAS